MIRNSFAARCGIIMGDRPENQVSEALLLLREIQTDGELWLLIRLRNRIHQELAGWGMEADKILLRFDIPLADLVNDLGKKKLLSEEFFIRTLQTAPYRSILYLVCLKWSAANDNFSLAAKDRS